ncbi:MAG: DUF255 domain-containing protein [Gammaproteobacteria bacterium]|nr:DUF255 domain-containing protein [Gammaproteobacteria bacterium]
MVEKSTRFKLLLVLMCVITATACSNLHGEQDANESNNTPLGRTEATSQGVEFFEGSLNDALSQAEKEDKNVFVFLTYDFGMWGQSCIVMREVVFSDPEVGEYFNKRFVNIEVDIENAFHFWNDVSVHDEFNLVVLPTYLISDGKGNGLGHAHGRASPKQLVSIVSRLLGETDSMFDELQTRYESGERSSQFIQQYLMAATEELAFRQLDRDDEASVNTYETEREKYKQIADAYFMSKPTIDLINETDAHLIMYFSEPPLRGDELVEFVLQHYDEFLAVSSETAMAQFMLHATTNAAEAAALAGDEKFIEYVAALESYPLNQALDHERTRVSKSEHFPESIKYGLEFEYYKARGDWIGAYAVLQTRLEEERDWPKYWSYSTVAAELVQSDIPAHHETALEYGRELHISNPEDPSYAAVYVAALMVTGKQTSADRVSEQYRKRVSRLFGDSTQLNRYEDELSSLLDRINETTTLEEQKIN